jgi:hypothetical protein
LTSFCADERAKACLFTATATAITAKETFATAQTELEDFGCQKKISDIDYNGTVICVV